MNPRLLFGAASLLAAPACTPAVSQTAWTPDPRYDAPMPEPRATLDEDGGFTYGGGSLFSRRRAREVGDQVTIRIVHATQADSSANTALKRGSETSGSVSALFGIETALASIPGGGPSLSLGASTTNDFDGTGATTRSGTLLATLTARVVEILPNGQLVVAGRQAVKINNEVEYLALTGVLDPRAIASDSSVSSTALADVRIEYSGQGVVAGKQRPGWLTRALDIVTPF
jgi:flagellar L-ring protein precursor FlgH